MPDQVRPSCEIDDIKYFQRKVYQSLNVPVSRLEQEQAYSLGRATEITREEIKFQKFVNRLRLRFSKLFIAILRQQLVLKGIITDSDWVDFFHNNIRVEYYKDNHYTVPTISQFRATPRTPASKQNEGTRKLGLARASRSPPWSPANDQG